MSRQKRVHGLATATLAMALTGCAATTVQPEQETLVTNLPLPTIVLVYKFAVNLNEVTANQGLFHRMYDATRTGSL